MTEDPEYKDWPRQSVDLRYELNARPEWEAPVCPFCENQIDQTAPVTIMGGDYLRLAHSSCVDGWLEDDEA